MLIDTQLLWSKYRRVFRIGALALAGLAALYIATPNLMRSREYSSVAALSDYVSESKAEMHRPSSPVQLRAAALSSPDQAPEVQPSHEPSPDRKLIRTTTLDVIVKAPSKASEEIIRLAEGVGGFLVTSQVSGGEDAQSASLTVRVPAAKFEEIRSRIRQLGLRVENENRQAGDVTKQYVDQEARLRNLRAQEQQYLGILRQATTVKDTLAASEQLNSVRGEIEQQQAEFAALSRQVETVAINVTLRAEADTRVFGLHWRPLYQLKIAARQGLDGLGDYAASMASFVFMVPTILLWMLTILVGAVIAWRILRWVGRVFFHLPKPAAGTAAS